MPTLVSALLRLCSLVSCLPLLETYIHVFVTNFLHCITAVSGMTGAEKRTEIE